MRPGRPGQAHKGNTPYYPMELYNGLVVPKPDRQAPSSDYDETPRLFRRFINTGSQSVQIYNGLRNKIATGNRAFGRSYLVDVSKPRPGQTRGNYGGFKPKGMSPYNYQDAFNAGPGSQPEHPGGPGTIATPAFENPMTG